MSLVWLIAIPLIGALAAWLADARGQLWSRWIAMVAVGLDLVLALSLWRVPMPGGFGVNGWIVDLALPWIPRFGIGFHLALDGLSLLMVVLTLVLGLAAVACSWTEIRQRVGFFHFNLLASVTGAIGVFLAFDLFLFFFFWELMLVPMYFLIAIWGHEQRSRAAIKFFLFTQAGGLLMLISIVALALLHAGATGVLTFDYFSLLGASLPAATAMWLMLGFFVAFAVKLPAVPLHTWLPDAHTEAPTAGSVILAGVLLKTGAYGLLRFVVPLFPEAALRFAPIAMALGVLGILYGAILAFAQHDLKRLIAYTSVSHLGFVLLGIFAWNAVALNGAIVQMIAHGLSTGALFVLVGILQERMHTRELGRMGGLWATMPRLSALGLFFAIASLGLPGLANFVGEFLILLGAYRVNVAVVAIAVLGLIAAAAYALLMVQRAFHGDNVHSWQLSDSTPREMGVLASMVVLVAWLGLYPHPVLRMAATAVSGLQEVATQTPRPLALELGR
ncbi:MAG TPA: NADH-quinone oxidoreductase subunit M [Burkholderiales bacterium]|nr:NADH-quinone oxidoreductase subunit M [Burkholderiales bacterium]